MKERWQKQWGELDKNPGLKRTWFVIKIIAADVSSLRGLLCSYLTSRWCCWAIEQHTYKIAVCIFVHVMRLYK